MKTKLYNIKKGSHYSSGLNLGISYKPEKIKFSTIFSENCLYHLWGEDRFDVNKLHGVSFGLHHLNSIRVGWNCEDGYGNINLFVYFFNNGVRRFFKLCSAAVLHEYGFEINFDYENNLFSVSVCSDKGVVVRTSIFDFKYPATKLGYKLFPYFGGNKSAPHDMDIFITHKK